MLGLLPAATYAAWSTWPPGVRVLGATLLGVVLLLSIGTAQTLVMRARATRAYVWISWTAWGLVCRPGGLQPGGHPSVA